MPRKHLYLGQSPTDVVNSLINNSNTEIIIKSQVTPEIRINLANLMAGKKKEETFESSGGNVALRVIKPEVIVKSLGTERSVAPYGKPEQNYLAIVIATLAGSALVGASLAFYICRRI